MRDFILPDFAQSDSRQPNRTQIHSTTDCLVEFSCVHGRKSTLQSGGDAQVERRRCEDRGAEGAEGVGSGEGVYPLPSRLGGLGERRELPQRGPGRSPGRQRFWYILSMKERRWWHLKVSHFGSMIIGNFYYFSFFLIDETVCYSAECAKIQR
jgi:hypothetical protein